VGHFKPAGPQSLRVIGRPGCLPNTDRATSPDGRRPERPIRLEGGNRGEVRDAAVAGLWGFGHHEWFEFGCLKSRAAGIGGGLVGDTGMRRRFTRQPGRRACVRSGAVMIAGQAPRWRAREQPANISKLGTLRVHGDGHELSIRIRIRGVGRCRGAQPRSNVSMTIIRPPQHGQGYEDGWGSPSSAAAVSRDCGCGSETLSN
jgi:hypothetical protein